MTGIAWLLMVFIQIVVPIAIIVFVVISNRLLKEQKGDFWKSGANISRWAGFGGFVLILNVVSIIGVGGLLAGMKSWLLPTELSELQQNYSHVLAGKELTFDNGKLTELSSSALTYTSATINIFMLLVTSSIVITFLGYMLIYLIDPSKVDGTNDKFIPFAMKKLRGGLGILLYALILMLCTKLILAMTFAAILGVNSDFVTTTFMQTFGVDGIDGLIKGVRTLALGAETKKS